MKFTVELLAVVILLFPSFLLKNEIEDQLPFISNYSYAVKSLSQQHFDRYDYSEFISGDDVLQIKCYHNISKEKAKKTVEDRTFFTLAMFNDQPSPYPGVLSSSIGCPKEFQPKANEDTVNLRVAFKLLATKNLIYGNCNPNDNFYYCAYCIFYCQDKMQLYEFKIFTPMNKPSFDYEVFIASLQCK